jgi:serine-type D-Ala-D-Ala carboxypeptidase/endopeptidase
MRTFFRTLVTSCVFIFTFISKAQTINNWRKPLEAAVNDRIEKRQFLDGAVGVIEGKNQDVALFGKVNDDTLFEIGSITKSFTGIIFAEMILENLIKPDDPVKKYFPELKGTFAGQIQLQDLATHKSGLARIPDNISDTVDPYGHYGLPELLAYLKQAVSPVEARPYPISYSNTGFALLGQILAKKVDHTDFPSTVKRRILAPLGMDNTFFVVDRENEKRFIQGHDENLNVVAHWNWDVFAPTGAIRSSLKDMLKFTRANLYSDSSHLCKAMTLSQKNSWGWDSEYFKFPFSFKNGGTGGFRSSFFVDPKNSIGAVVLTDTTYEPDSLLFIIRKSLLAH